MTDIKIEQSERPDWPRCSELMAGFLFLYTSSCRSQAANKHEGFHLRSNKESHPI